MPVELVPRECAGGGVAGLDRIEDLLLGSLAGKQRVNLFQRHAPVGGDLDEMFLGLGDAVGLGHAEVMPDRVLDVLRVDSLVHLKLLAPGLVFAGVVVNEAALPVVRFLAGHHLDELVEVSKRVVKL